jgi:hypothetical protein
VTRNYRKERGRETEYLVARRLAEDGWPYAEPTGSGTPGRDIKGTPGIAIEVKARADFSPAAFMRQATRNAGGDLAVVVIRPIGGGESNLDAWPAMISFADLRRLLHAAGYGTPPDEPSTVVPLRRAA